MGNDQFREPSAESRDVGYETATVSIKGLAIFLVCLVVVGAVIHTAMWFLLNAYLVSDRKKDVSHSALTDDEYLKQYDSAHDANLQPVQTPFPPPPRLQPTAGLDPQNVPREDLQLMYSKEDRVFRRMGWTIDPQSHYPLQIPGTVLTRVMKDASSHQNNQAGQ